MNFFNQSWNDISRKCSCWIYELDTEVSPYKLINDWVASKDTLEKFSDNPDCINNTTAEKAKIRQERLDIFLPNMEKEYQTFLKLAKKQNLISKLIKFEEILGIIIFLTSCYFCTKFLFFLAPFINKILQNITGSQKSFLTTLVYIVCFLLIPFSYFLSWRVADRFPYILTYPSILLLCDNDFRKRVRLDKEHHLRSFFKKTPYTIAFLSGNGFANQRDLCPPYDTDIWDAHYNFVIPYKEIKKLNFNEFINYIKIRVEPTFKSYHRIDNYVDAPKYVETKAMQSLFFYLNEEDLKNTSKLRSKTLKSASFAKDIECYIEPKEPRRNEYGQIIIERDSYKDRHNENTYSRYKPQYNRETVSQKSSPKPKKQSSYDKILDEWKEQIRISTFIENKRK